MGQLPQGNPPNVTSLLSSRRSGSGLRLCSSATAGGTAWWQWACGVGGKSLSGEVLGGVILFGGSLRLVIIARNIGCRVRGEQLGTLLDHL